MLALVSAKSLQKRLRAAVYSARSAWSTKPPSGLTACCDGVELCRLQIRVLERSRSGKHKFKLGGMRVAWGRDSGVANCSAITSERRLVGDFDDVRRCR